ncbi:cell wall hydrolase [Microbaculum sp. FT89]|uniref:cell wall hydrolase n=1 Tax=Microbaculum sp. FT89 TaxID=3447298 RepID=UPI003F52F64B
MRRIAALSGGHRVRSFAPYLLALGGFLASTVQAAYQDAAAVVDIEAASSPRWMATLVAQPYGSVHAAKVALPLRDQDADFDKPIGISLSSLGVPSETIVVARQSKDGDPVVTGSIGDSGQETPSYPEVVRETKGDLMMSRAGFGERFKVDPDAGGMVRIPRYVIEPPEPADKPMIQSFLKVDPPKNGKPVMVASLDPQIGLNHVIAFQPLLASPLEEVWRGRIEIDDFERDRHCLATAVYFEARGESEDGQRAVAQVVLNRVLDSRYPSTVCGVVFQNQSWRNRCQFSFACDGRPERIDDKGSWSKAVKVAEDALVGDYFDEGIGEATHYHATYVRPRWSRYLKKVERVGTHIFYQLRPGQR